jgi:hypothetical protein
MPIHWRDVARQQAKNASRAARQVGEMNRSYQQRADSINGWQGGGGKIMKTYRSLKSAATMGGSGGTTAGP